MFSKFLLEKSAPAHFGTQMSALGKSVNERTKRALNDSEFANFRAKFDDFLKNFDGIYLNGDYEQIAKRFVSSRLSKALKTLKNVFNELDEKSEITRFHDARIDLKKVRYELEFFVRMYDSSALGELYKKIKSEQESFGRLQDISIWQNFIAIYQRASDKNNESFGYLLSLNNELAKQTNSIKSEILGRKGEFIQSIKKAISKIKIYK